MNEQKQQVTNETNEINDLTVTTADEIKGGPKRIFIGGISVKDTQGDGKPDTGQTDPIPGGTTVNGVSLNHNETLADDEDTEAEVVTETFDDLPVSDEQATQTKGGIGMLLPAVQKVREAASR